MTPHKLNKKTLIIIAGGATILALGLWFWKRHTSAGESAGAGELISSGGVSGGGAGATSNEQNEEREGRQGREKAEQEEREAERKEGKENREAQVKENEAERSLAREEGIAARNQPLAERQQQWEHEHPPGASPAAATPGAAPAGFPNYNPQNKEWYKTEKNKKTGAEEHVYQHGRKVPLASHAAKKHAKTNKGQKGEKKPSHSVTKSTGHSVGNSRTGAHHPNHPAAKKQHGKVPAHKANLAPRTITHVATPHVAHAAVANSNAHRNAQVAAGHQMQENRNNARVRQEQRRRVADTAKRRR